MDLQHPPSENGHGVCHTHYPRHYPPQDQHHNIVANPTPISTSWPQSIHARALQQANLLTRASPNQNPVVGHGQESSSSQQGLTSREPTRSEVDRSEVSKAESREDVWSPEEIFNFELAAAAAESVEEHVNDVTGNGVGGGLQSAIPTLRQDITGSWPHSANHSLVGACPSQLVEHEVALNAQLGGPSFSTFVSPPEQFETASRNLSSPRHYPIPPTPSPHLHKARRTISRSTFRTPSTSQSYASAPSAHIPQISQVILPSTVVPSNLTVTPTTTNSVPPVSPSTTPGQDRIVKLDELTAPSQLLQNSASLYGVTPQVSGMGVTRGPGQTDGTGSPSRLLGWTPTNSTSVDVVLGLGSKLDASTRHSGRKRRKLTRKGSPAEISDSDLGLAADSDADNDSDVYQPPGRSQSETVYSRKW
ncbi:hypothetical protein BDN72DRAFT_643062 [Pluteus cervinus]|uniref:Uncharacterized protein n=1 Tax=Pluteus cervinus TaxID=181527 RepID=A0ACD3ATX0_9AGAR|nr:hypothetical protein BDN72DRAFT_643062 [Pluteus cervinus]